MTFLTLFLGLVSGPQSVALAAGPGVAAVELMLDGAGAARLAEPPWVAVVDFGAGLLPHHLVARGLDARGREVALAEQWINLPRPPAEVEIVLEKAAEGPPRAVRLAWQSLTSERPVAISLTLDGKPLPLDADRRAPLPPLAGNAGHLLSAQLGFGDGLVARKDLVLGGEYGDEVTTDLTAFAVRLRKGDLPPPAQLQGWFSAAGKPLRVSAVESGAARLFVVRDIEAIHQIWGSKWYARAEKDWFELGKGGAISFISPTPKSVPSSGIPFQLFPGSQELDSTRGGIPFLLTHAHTPGERRAGQQLADAVAVAGVQAEAGSGPRAVLLVLGGGASDRSRYDGAVVRRYLAAIHVPLFVWQVGPVDAATQARWGTVEDISDLSGLESAFHTLERELAAQRLVLVEGRHLPQTIALSPAAAGLDLVP